MDKRLLQILPLLAVCIGAGIQVQAQVADASLTIDGVLTMLPITAVPNGYAVESLNGGAVHVTGMNGDNADIMALATHMDNTWQITYTLDWQNPGAPGSVAFAIRAPVHPRGVSLSGPTLVNGSLMGTAVTLDANNYIYADPLATYPNDPAITLPAEMGPYTIQRSFLGIGTTAYDTNEGLGTTQAFPTPGTYAVVIGPNGPVNPDPVGSPQFDYQILTTSFSTGGNGITVDLTGIASETYVPEPGAAAILAGAAFSLTVAARRRARRKRPALK